MTPHSVTDERTALIERSLHVGDPIADAVIAELDELGAAGRHLLNEGLRGGLSSLADVPPAIAALLRESEATPDWVDTKGFAAGESAFLSVEPIWTQIVLSVDSLLLTYSAPRIARVLTGTGRLVSTTQRRLQETGKWLNNVVLPGGMERGAPGYVDTVQVRLMHARVRATSVRHGWDADTLGAPINQVDLARTWLDFTYSPFRALEKLGVTFTDEEAAAMYRYWHQVAHLLGVDPAFYRGIVDHQRAGELYDAFVAISGVPDENARALSSALLEVLTGFLSELAFKTPLPLTEDLVAAFARRILGDELCDQLGIAATDLVPVIGLLAERNAQVRRWQRTSPEAWQQAREENIGARRFLLSLTEGATTYQQNLA
jgi:hypothetical protein